MTFDTPSRMQVVRKHEKEPRLKEFIRLELARLEALPHAADIDCLLIARTVASPVVRAMSAFCDELAARGIRVRAVLASLEASQPTDAPPAHWLESSRTRWLRNQRLIDAHEMLVIGDTAAWVGDCMRRDPLKRDAFEFYSPDSAAVGKRATASFERIWALSELVSPTHKWRTVATDAADGQLSTSAATAAAVTDAPAEPLPGATRH
jgi:hypothetical protein